jgi:3-oxoacyl-[acyl-carrier protein] reductase
MIPIDLSNRTALVTGAGQGLGACTAQRLSDAGASVIINYFNDAEGVNKRRAEETVQKIGQNAVPLEGDVRNPGALKIMFDRIIDLFGSLHVVINNAGVIKDRTIKKMNQKEWQDVIDTNLTGTFNVCREAAVRLEDGGRIINLSSISGVIGFFGQSNYAASKAGIVGMTKVLSKELARRKITVNAVAPGVILTEMGKTIPEEVRAEMLRAIPLGEFGEPEDIANLIVFLCSDLASYITGQLFHVNGGWFG